MKTKEELQDKCFDVIGRGIQVFLWLSIGIIMLAVSALYFPFWLAEKILKAPVATPTHA